MWKNKISFSPQDAMVINYRAFDKEITVPFDTACRDCLESSTSCSKYCIEDSSRSGSRVYSGEKMEQPELGFAASHFLQIFIRAC